MKTLPKAIATVVLIAFGTLASGAAMAQHRGHGVRDVFVIFDNDDGTDFGLFRIGYHIVCLMTWPLAI